MSEPVVQPIPQTDPRAGYLAHQAGIDAAIRRVLDGGRYILGEEVAAFEREFAGYIGVAHAFGVGNGTDAIELALRACGIGAGQSVITVAHTAVATVAAIERAGAQAVFTDIDPATFTMDPEHLETILRKYRASPSQFPWPAPAAVMPVHIYGQPADITAICEIARRYDLLVVEDCAQSHGAEVGGVKTGVFGEIAAFSFYPTKNLGALGDGGLVLTRDPRLAEQVGLLRQYGWRTRDVSELPGLNSRLDELQAAILRVKLKHLDAENEARRAIAVFYDQSITGQVKVPAARPGVKHVYHQYVIRTENRTSLRAYLDRRQVGTGIHYPQPVHLQPAYRGRFADAGPLPVTEAAAGEILSLPMHPYLKPAQFERVAGLINRWDPAV